MRTSPVESAIAIPKPDEPEARPNAGRAGGHLQFSGSTECSQRPAGYLLLMQPTVLIVDDHAGFRAVARTLLERAGYEVIGEAGDGAAGIGAARELGPDLVLLDIQLPDMDGFAVAHELAGGDRQPRVVLISTREASDYGDEVANAPVAGFIHKPELSGASLAAFSDLLSH